MLGSRLGTHSIDSLADDDDDDDGGGSDDDDVEDYHQDHDEDSVTCTFLICDLHFSDTANLISLFL